MLVIGLPKSTEFNKRIPKQKFYDNISVTPALKRCFVEQIKNPYCFRCGDAVVKTSFLDTDVTLEDCVESYLRNL